jgi:dihydropteroate synthase
MIYVRPIVMTDAARPKGALTLAGGWCWFDRVEMLERGRSPKLGDIDDLTAKQRQILTAPRANFANLVMNTPRIMGILNVTPDSFSDGGMYLGRDAALEQGRAIANAADILDIGGESTRPGAVDVANTEEIARTAPVIKALRNAGVTTAISIDTRKADVAEAALGAGANIVNDVAALGFDPALAGVVGNSGAPVILMHAQGAPSDMQTDPRYGDVALDVYDFLAERVRFAVAAGIAPSKIVIDPGIGFGKTVAHNLALIRQLSLFHGLGCPILLGASRKRFIGTISGTDEPQARLPGSLAVALSAVAQGAQILRVHDVVETRQALALWRAVNVGDVA